MIVHIVIISFAKKENSLSKAALYYGLEHATGIEPARLAWEAKVLPLNYACIL